MQYFKTLSLLVVTTFSFCTLGACTNSNLYIPSKPIEPAQNWVDSVMNSLTLREKIAQLFMVAAYSNKGQDHIDEITKLVVEEKIGGLCFFQGGPVRQANLCNYYQSLIKVPLLISMDAEWGLGMRLDSTISYPRQMLLGAMDDNRLIYQMGAEIATHLKRMGVHMNFAPVVDINNNPLNPVINTRAFGDDREAVTQKGLAYMMGLQDNGILACAKHFPGHGDTDTDSHKDLPLLIHNSDRIDSLELYPFRKLVQSGVSAVMVGHMEIPALEPISRVPSSLSYQIVSSILVGDLKFNGLIVTDALNMKGVTKNHRPVELNYMALKAGNDIILFPSKVKASISKIERQVLKGRFPVEEIERRCRKVIEAKYKVGLNSYKPIKTQNLVADLNQTSSELINRQIVEQGITVIKNSNDALPLRRLDTLNIAYLEIGPGMGKSFGEQMELYAPITTFAVNPGLDDSRLNDLYFELLRYNTIIIGYHTVASSPKLDFGISAEMNEFIARLACRKLTILSLFGSPYSMQKMDYLPSIEGLIVAYDNTPITQNVTAQLIFGGVTVTGRLPVTVSSDIAKGSGQDAGTKIRLKYSIPEELNLKASYFQRIDSIARDAMEKNAAPGMQILVAHKGVVVYNKNFGNFTYSDQDLKVNYQSLYDVASITKIASTLPLVMDLYSKGELNLNDSLGKYMAIPDTSAYNRIRFQDILLHQAGLVAWIPFYERTLSSLWFKEPIMSPFLSEEYPYQLARNRFMSKHAFPSRKYYRNEFSYQFPHQVAQGLYASENIKDSIYSWIYRTPIGKVGTYRYSDLGHILMFRALENIINTSYEDYLFKNFYSGLGMHNSIFNPLEKFGFDRIVPTENDVIFRKQLIWGFVHDPAAAMMGGIAGHAGLFSTANDLAKLLQMYLNGGEYGGRRYIPERTLTLFTSCVNCNNGIRRGLGFDKPEVDTSLSNHVSRKASSLSYGHSGFTGSLVWVDPVYELVYICISNRIFPDAQNTKLVQMNVRTKIQDVVYDALIDKDI